MNHEIIFRILFFTVFITTVAISAFYRRRARRSGEVIPRHKEGSLAMVGRLILGLALLTFILLYLFSPDWINWSRVPFPPWIRWIGVGSAVMCPPLSIWIFKNIGKNISETVLTKQDHQLVTSGPYRWVRHPLYTTGILMIFSLGLIAGNWVILLMGFVSMFIFWFFVIPKEEEYLIKKFGEQYKNYRSTTGTLMPRL